MGSNSDVSAFFRLRFRNGLGTKPAGVLPFRMRVPNTFFLSLAWWLAGFQVLRCAKVCLAWGDFFSLFLVGSKSNVSAVFWLRFRMVWALYFFLFNVTGLLTGTVGKHNWNCCFGPAAASASEQSRTSCGHTASKLLQYKKLIYQSMPDTGVVFKWPHYFFFVYFFFVRNIFRQKTGRYLKSWDYVFVICLRHRFIKVFPFCSGLLGAETRENGKVQNIFHVQKTR